MIQIQFNPMIGQEIKQRHEELAREVAFERIIRENLSSPKPKAYGKSRILAKIGIELISMGASLKERYGSEPGEE